MDTRKYGSAFLRPDDVRKPRQERILAVLEGQKFDRLELKFESGDQLGLNKSNTRALQQAYGTESDSWLKQTVELSIGHYKDRDSSEEKETVVLRPVSVRQPSPTNGGAKTTAPTVRPPMRNNPDDKLPF